jgi:hypothetical protein
MPWFFIEHKKGVAEMTKMAGEWQKIRKIKAGGNCLAEYWLGPEAALAIGFLQRICQLLCFDPAAMWNCVTQFFMW